MKIVPEIWAPGARLLRFWGAILLASGACACSGAAASPVHAPDNPVASASAPEEAPGDAPAAAAPSGVTIRDAPTGYDLTLRIGDKHVCMMVPEGGDGSPACSGLNLEKFRESFANRKMLRGGQRVIGLAFVRFKGWSAIVSTLFQPGNVDFDNPTTRSAFVTGMREGALKKTPGAVLHGDSEDEPYSIATIGGRTGVSVTIEREAQEGSVASQMLARWRMYSVSVKGGVITTSFVSGIPHFPDLVRFAKASMATVRLPELEPSRNVALAGE